MNQEQYYNEKAAYELLEKYKDISKKLMVIFWIMVIANVFSLINLGATVVSTLLQNSDMTESVELIFTALNVLIGLSIGIIIFTMREYDDQLKLAGIFYIICQLGSLGSSLADSFLGSGNCISLIFKLIAGVLGILYIINYTRAISAITFNVSSSLANSWDNLRKVYLAAVTATVVCAFLIIIPFINLFAALILLVAMVAMIVVGIWQMVITFMTSRAMDKYELE